MAQSKAVRKVAGKTRTTTKTAPRTSSPRSAKSSPRKRAGGGTAKGEAEVTIDRRRTDRRKTESPLTTTTPPLERRKKVSRRRQIDPTTCERDYTPDEVEFMNALDDYKRRSGRMFPTCSEVLEVIRSLNYVKLSSADLAALPSDSLSAASAKPMPDDQSLASISHTEPADSEQELD